MKLILPLLSALLLALPIVAAPIVPVPAVAVPQAPADEAKAVKVFKKAYHPKKPQPVSARQTALTNIAAFDSQKVAKSLVDGHVAVGNEIESIDVQRVGWLAEYVQLTKGKEFEEKPSYPRPVFNRINELKKLLQDSRANVDELRGLHAALRAQIGALTEAQAVKWLVKNVLASKKHTLLLKLTVSRLAGQLSDRVLDDLQRVFAKAKKPAQIVALLEGISFAEKNAQKLAPQIIKLLKHKEQPVRERAAYALSKIAAPEAIEPLIDLLETEKGRAQENVAAALEVLTRQNHGVLVASWRRWYADEKEKLLAGKAPLGGGMFARNASTKDMGYYFDIAMDGQSIMYIIDSSGSMKAEIELVLKNSKGEPKKDTRLEACKGELISALGRLERDAEFNIIWYNNLPYLFSEQMLKASKADVKRGQDWVKQLKPNSSTNIYDSLKMAFDVAGQGSKDKYYGVELDTIFLLTDGSPTKPDGKADSTEKIIEAVREWNVLKRIKIHCIGIGKNINTAFLEQLARENNGEFRKY